MKQNTNTNSSTETGGSDSKANTKNKRKRTIIIYSLIAVLILISIYTAVYIWATHYLTPVENFKNTTPVKPTFFQIADITEQPIEIVWEDTENILISSLDEYDSDNKVEKDSYSTGQLSRYNIKNRQLKDLGSINDIEHTRIGSENDHFLLCKWKNFEITSPKQIATIVKVYSIKSVFLKKYYDTLANNSKPNNIDMIGSNDTDNRNDNSNDDIDNNNDQNVKLVTTLSSSETFKPINCTTNKMFFVTSIPILKEQYYSTQISDISSENELDNNLKQLESIAETKQYEISGENTVIISQKSMDNSKSEIERKNENNSPDEDKSGDGDGDENEKKNENQNESINDKKSEPETKVGNKVLFRIPKYNNIASFYVSPNEKSVVLVSETGDLFVYTKS